MPDDPADPREQSIQVYDVAERRILTVWKAKSQSARLDDVEWFYGADTALAIVTEKLRTIDPAHPNPTRQEAILIDARNGSAKTVFAVDQDDGMPQIGMNFAPTKPYALLSTQSFVREPGSDGPGSAWRFQFRPISATGAMGQPIDVDSGVFFSGWTNAGASPVLMLHQKLPAKGTTGYTVDMATGHAEAKPFVPFTAPEPGYPIQIVKDVQTLTKLKANHLTKPVWLSNLGSDSVALISSDGVEGSISPALNAVAYISQGVAMVRPLIELPKDLYLQALKAAERTKTLSNAKQVGLALMMYSNDMDDKYPSSQEDIGKLIDPYLKDPSIFAGFQYTFAGGSMSDINKPCRHDSAICPESVVEPWSTRTVT